MPDQEPRVQWYRCGEHDPDGDGFWLTFDPQNLSVNQSSFKDGEWRTGDRAAAYWAKIVDVEPSGDSPFKFCWIKASDQLPPPPKGVFVVVWARANVLRLAQFDGGEWRDGGSIICEPDWWASADIKGGLESGPSTAVHGRGD